MDENQLIIVGNGFDVNHGIPSSYAHFKTWLSNTDKELYDAIKLPKRAIISIILLVLFSAILLKFCFLFSIIALLLFHF